MSGMVLLQASWPNMKQLAINLLFDFFSHEIIEMSFAGKIES